MDLFIPSTITNIRLPIMCMILVIACIEAGHLSDSIRLEVRTEPQHHRTLAEVRSHSAESGSHHHRRRHEPPHHRRRSHRQSQPAHHWRRNQTPSPLADRPLTQTPSPEVEHRRRDRPLPPVQSPLREELITRRGSDTLTSTQSTPGVSTHSEECHACEELKKELLSPMSAEDLRKARIEEIKESILLKLRLERAPNISFPIESLPSEPVKELNDQLPAAEPSPDTEQYFAETKSQLVFATTVFRCGHNNSRVCFTIPFKRTEDSGDISAAELYVKYRSIIDDVKDYVVVLKIRDVSDRRQPVLVKQAYFMDAQSYTKMEILEHIKVKQESSTASTNITFEVECESCDIVRLYTELRHHLPYLSLSINSPAHRSRRSVARCREGSDSCCLTQFYVDFTELGWSHWIMQPKGYWANYCAGSCAGMRHLLSYQHSRVVDSSNIRRKPPHCCAPKTLSSISMLYIPEDGQIKQAQVPEMRVESCGCV